MTRRDNEGPIQRAIVQYLRLQYPQWIVHHCKNEINKRGGSIALEIAKAKGKGAVKGFPDLIVLPWAHIGPIFFEVKAPGNYADKDQQAIHMRLRTLGYRVAVVRSIEDVQAEIAGWHIDTRAPSVSAGVVEIKGEIR